MIGAYTDTGARRVGYYFSWARVTSGKRGLVDTTCQFWALWIMAFNCTWTLTCIRRERDASRYGARFQ